MSGGGHDDLMTPADDNGGQRALGERRRRRLAERGGEVDLDATMSSWPVTEPPSTPRPVVRQPHTLGHGAATAPARPTPYMLVVGPLLEAVGAERAGTVGPVGSRRGHRMAQPVRELAPTPTVPGSRDRAEARGATRSEDDPSRQRSTETARRPAPAPTVPTVPTGTLVPAGSRRPRRDLLLGMALVVVLLAVLGVVLGLLLRPGGAAVEPDGGAVGTAGTAAQQTLLLAVTDDSGRVGVAGLLAVDDDRLSVVLLPDNLLLTVADAAQLPLAQSVTIGPSALQRGVEDTLSVRVDGTLVLSGAQLAALVDGAGGVVVDVAEQVGSTVPAGDDQRLAGGQALTYATEAVDGRPAEERLARFGSVLTNLLAALPEDPADSRAALESAGVSGGTVEPEAAAAVLAPAASRASTGDGVAVILPTTELAGGAQQPWRGVDEDAVEAQLADRLAGARLPVSALGPVEVVVRNGVGVSGLVTAARDRLVAAGLSYGGGGNATSFDVVATVVLLPADTPEDRARGEAVAAALGVGSDSLQVSQEAAVGTDVVVVLGTDFAETVSTERQSDEGATT